ncbi:MAG TPA: molybdopterin cofactor-binding domain-containing protein, partial [Steroidobacteraceae bacterium]|nr:molybdopterin cofactor-binding domain-containing protein [Steroidobacteraceae bacterium]
WLAIHADNPATLYIGFAELGQGATTALLQVAAEELDLAMTQIRAAPLDTHLSPNQGGTYSSAAVQRGRPQVTNAAAHARAALLARAAQRLGVAADTLTVDRGVVRSRAAAGMSVSYGELIGGQRFELRMQGTPALKSVADYRLVGAPLPRADLTSRVDGTHTYIQHLRLPGMLHGRIVRPRGQGRHGAGARVLSLDESSIAQIPGARLLRQGEFLAVVAPAEWAAVRAADRLQVSWEESPDLPGSEGLHAQMRSVPTTDNVVAERGDAAAAAATAATRVQFTGHGPYQAHAPFAPNCALADIGAAGGLVICSSQDIYACRRGLATLLKMPQEALRVQFAENAGTYGHSCYDDAAQAAALMSQLAGAPVRVQFMRHDEHGWDTYGPPHVGEARIAADADGRIVAYEYEGWQHNWSQVESTSQLAGAAVAAEWPPVGVQGVNPLVCGGMYEIPNLRLVNHRLPGLDYLRAGWLRSPLDLSFTFVSEQAIDALALQVRVESLEFRRRNIRDARWRGVLDAAAAAADWSAAWTPGRLSGGRLRRGRGIALGTHLVSYGAAVAEIEVDIETGRVRILRLTGALDAGLVVNPLIVERQIEGQLVQTASRMLLEEVRFDQRRVTSLDWQGYPILRMRDCPDIRAVIVQRTGERSTGAGEETMAAAAAAIANAFHDATGVRMRRYPLLPARVLEALAGGPEAA